MPTQQLKQFIDNLAAFNFAASQERAIESNTDALAQFQAEQFAQGKDKNNEPITLNGKGYAVSTIIKKRLFGRGLGAITSHVTLFQTGALYHELFASMQGKKVTFSSKVPYYDELISRTGDVTGLNADNAKDFAFEFVLPFVSKELNAKTGLRIKVGGNEL